MLRLGKNPAVSDARDLRFASYLTPDLPTPPATFGHSNLFGGSAWGMLGNDQYGDCAWAGPAHETMVLTKLGGHPARFTTAGVLSDYASTGFDPATGAGDNGSDVRQVADYRRKTGIVDSKHHRHKIGAYTFLRPGDVDQARTALYLLDAVGVGIQFPSSAMEQFNKHLPWTVDPSAKIEGGHYVPAVGVDGPWILVVSWGRLVRMHQDFYAKYCDEALAYVSSEQLVAGMSPEGFNARQLAADLKRLRQN